MVVVVAVAVMTVVVQLNCYHVVLRAVEVAAAVVVAVVSDFAELDVVAVMFGLV